MRIPTSSETVLEGFGSKTSVAHEQALRLYILINHNRQSLRDTDPELLSIFGRSVTRCLESITANAANTGTDLFLLRNKRTVVGLASVVFDRSIWHPEGIFDGNQIDYWLPFGSGETMHEEAVGLLTDLLSGESAPVLATTPRVHSNPQIGFAALMQEVDGPALLLYRQPEGHYERPPEAQEEHLYVGL